ncbi:hypothetical protein CsSME_00041811 [Camellia sinensis var. sinensis]
MGSLIFIPALLLSMSSAVFSCLPSDRAALMALRAVLHEPHHLGIFNSWNGTDYCHNWFGVSCDPTTRRVANINLRGESEDPIYEKAHRTGFMTGYISPSIHSNIQKLISVARVHLLLQLCLSQWMLLFLSQWMLLFSLHHLGLSSRIVFHLGTVGY